MGPTNKPLPVFGVYPSASNPKHILLLTPCISSPSRLSPVSASEPTTDSDPANVLERHHIDLSEYALPEPTHSQTLVHVRTLFTTNEQHASRFAIRDDQQFAAWVAPNYLHVYRLQKPQIQHKWYRYLYLELWI